MRVITGSARGRRLMTLEGNDTRPTADKVKEGLFSALQFELEGRRVLDLFAGSGALGIEALSRGAAHCTFVEKDRRAAEVVRQNLQSTDLAGKAQVHCTDAVAFLSRADVYDAILVDPPYASGLAASLLPQLGQHLAQGGWLVCETRTDAELPAQTQQLVLAREYRYGKIKLSLYRRA